MSRLLVAVRDEIGAEEKRHQETMEKLRELERLAEELNAERKRAPAGGGSPSQVAARRVTELEELLKRQGLMSQKEIVETTGWSEDSLRRALGRLKDQGRVHPTGKRVGGGYGSPEWAHGPEGDSSPEPRAAVSTNRDAAAKDGSQRVWSMSCL